MTDSDLSLTDAFDDVVARLVAIAGLGGIAITHVLQLEDVFASADYLGILFIAAIVASVVLATLLTRMSGELVWAATGALGALVLIGFVLSRTSGLPSFTEEIGEWTDPFGLLSIVSEGLLVCVSAAVFASHARMPEASTHPWARQTSRTLKPHA
jgi:hypothetical protein